MCVWCPLWPVQRLRSEEHEQRPLVLFARERRGYLVTVCSPEMRAWGVRAGMSLGEARSLLPTSANRVSRIQGNDPARRDGSPALPVLKEANPAADRLRLQSLARHCHRYSPLAGIEEGDTPESIWLDISGSEVLFGGEQGLADVLRTDLAQQGIQVRIAIADSWGAAWGISHYGDDDVTLVPPGEQDRWLSALPVAALRIPEKVTQLLQVLDVCTVGQLRALPRTSLPSRFGKELLHRLDQALGLVPEFLSAERLAEPVVAEWSFEDPVTDRLALDHVCERLIDEVLTKLAERRAALQELTCHWLGAMIEPTVLRLLRPTTQKRHLLELLQLQNERQFFTCGIHGIRMEVAQLGLPPVRQARLFDDEADTRQTQLLAELVDRLSHRLGRQDVIRPQLTTDPLPESACEAVPWLTPQGAEKGEPVRSLSLLRSRPLRLLSTPQPLTVDAVTTEGLPARIDRLPVMRISGPERIETGWWRGPDLERDYYRIDLTRGITMWAFIDRETGGWFLHGLFV